MSAYLVFKALHLIAMVAWFAGLFYMFRLFVYHTENADKPQVCETLKVMERRLYKVITVPAMVATWIFGLTMIGLNPEIMKSGGWLHAKILFVFLLSGYMGLIGKTVKRYAADDIAYSSKTCRILNEVPTVFLILIVFLAVLRPF